VRGLAFFHTHNILDMKSPNILLNAAGAKVADIGLGRKMKEGETISSESRLAFPKQGKEGGAGDLIPAAGVSCQGTGQLTPARVIC